MAIRYEHIRDLAEHVKAGLEVKVKTFSFGELFEVLTKVDSGFMGRRSPRRIADVLASIGFDVTINYGRGVFEVTPTIPLEDIQKRALSREYRIVPRPAPTVIPTMRRIPAVMHHIQEIARQGWPVEKAKIERLTKLAGYKLRER